MYNGTDKLFFEVEYNTKSECSLVPEYSTLPARSMAQTLPCTIDLINSMRGALKVISTDSGALNHIVPRIFRRHAGTRWYTSRAHFKGRQPYLTGVVSHGMCACQIHNHTPLFSYCYKMKCTIPHRYMIDWSKQECNT